MRRQKGEGRHWQKDGKHYYRIRKNGKDYTVQDRDPKRAREKFKELRATLEAGIKVDKGRELFGEYVTRYLETALRVSDSTAQDYARRASYYILPWLKRYSLSALTLDIGEAWVAALVAEGYAYSTITQSLRLAQRILARAAGERLIPFNPFAAVQPPRMEQPQVDDEEGAGAFTVEQEAALLADARGKDKWGTYPLYLLAFRLGLRRGELLGLRRRDIDFDAGIIRIRQQVVKMDEGPRISKTLKTPAARRDLPLLEEIAAALRPLLLRLGGGEDALLFPGKTGGARHPDAATRQFARACKRLGIGGLSLHDCRHTAITRWRERRIDAETVAALAGHETPQVSLEVYSAVSVERKRRALGE